jgi:tRNA modification GTPase
MQEETIAAIATGAAPGGVGVIRVSGERAIEIVAAVVGVRAEELDRRVRYAIARDGDGGRIDDVLVFAMRAPRSFTGEDVAELQGHGGAVNLGRLLRAVLQRGARPAEPGEFSRRALHNGKLDLARAEGLLGVIEAGSERAWRIAQAQLAGSLGKALEALEERARVVLAEVEGAIDFPDEKLDEQSDQWVREQLVQLAGECSALASSYRAGAAIRNGVTVALVGEVNVGKSSLFNALVGKERALVSDTPGTTRDFVEAQVEWDGVRVTLVDTAGWRESSDAVERSGIEVGKVRAQQADVVVMVHEGAVGPGAALDERCLVVRSKADLGGAGDGLATSAKTGQGLAELKARALALMGVAESGGDGEVLVTERQHRLAQNTAGAFGRAVEALGRLPRELVSYDIREGYKGLIEIRLGDPEDRVVDEIFARFCIGK